MAQALNFAHSKGYIHRDIKPDNVMFREDGSAVLTDFGIARTHDTESQVTMVGQVLGTPKYMSPEQIRGKEIDGRSDIYALGIMFYQMLTKEAPYTGADYVTLALEHCNSQIPKFPREYAKYQNIFERMVAKNKALRFQTGEEISRIFEEILTGKMSAASIDSADAVALKKTLKFNPLAQGQGMAAPSGYIPIQFSVVLQDVDPLFDEDWQLKVLSVLKELSAEKAEFAFAKFLIPKAPCVRIDVASSLRS